MKSLFLLHNAEIGVATRHNVAMHLFALAWPGSHLAACGPDGHPYGLKPFSRRRGAGLCHAFQRFDGGHMPGDWFERVGEHIRVCALDFPGSVVYLEDLPGVSSEGVWDGARNDRWGPDVDELPASVPENHVWRLRRWYCYNRAVYLCREAATKEQA